MKGLTPFCFHRLTRNLGKGHPIRNPRVINNSTNGDNQCALMLYPFCPIGAVVACGARGPGFDPRLATRISEIGYLLLPSRDIAEIPLKRRKSSKQPTNQFCPILSYREIFDFSPVPCLCVCRLQTIFSDRTSSRYWYEFVVILTQLYVRVILLPFT